MEMTPEACSTDKAFYDSEVSQCQSSIQQQYPQYLQLPQRCSLSTDYLQEHNLSKQPPPPSTPSSTLSSPKLTFRESLRESLRDIHVPKILSNLRKSASEISLVFEAMRYGSSPIHMRKYGMPSSSGFDDIANGRYSKSTGGNDGTSTFQKRKRNAIVTWHNYSPHHLSKQLRCGKL
ncbi:unnamed protein product [Thelazia callipaeda]|uniref:Ovule protein n=1 Tax=Thelazia callipaeda TaxID=103827 RepID=A0A0N5D3V9_THECL|nr:unnamed protein product [Thelazia callipaeda]